MFDYLSNLDVPYRGVLYVGLMITESGEPSVVEFNVRFGDPECQITLPLIKSDLYDLLNYSANDRLAELDVEFHQAHTLTIVLASEGYPTRPEKNRQISGLEFDAPVIDIGQKWVNFAGVKQVDGIPLSNGGRVLSCSAMAETLESASKMAYELIQSINLEGSFYRSDIGSKAL